MLTSEKFDEIRAVARRRVACGLTLHQVAKLIGLDAMRICRWERGRAALPAWGHGKLLHLISDIERLRSLMPYGWTFGDLCALRRALKDLRSGRFDALAPATPEQEGGARE